MGQSPLSEYYNTEGDGLPFFQGKAEFGDFYPEAVKWCSKPGKIAGKDDILISVRAPVGPTNLAPSECCIGRGLAAIRPNGDIPNKYLLYYLRSIENEIDSYGTGTTFRAISGKILKSLSVPIAPLEQQKRIVAEIEKQFSRLDEAVANLRRVKANLKRYKAAVLKAAVEGKLTEEWRKQHPDVEPASKLLERILAERRQKWEEAELAKMKAKGKAPEDDKWKNKYKEPECFGYVDFTIPKSWMVATVQQLAERVQYGSSSKTKEDTDGIPVLRMGNIFEGELSLEKLKYLPQKHNEFPELFLKDDDLLFNRTNSPELVGKTAVYKGKPSPCSFASYLIRVQLMPGVEAKFLSYYINSMHGRQWVKSVVTQQVGQANVNGTKLQALIIPVPPAMEQKTIVSEMENRFSLMNGMEVAVETNMLRAERLRQSILSKAFTGQLIELIALGEE
jgi:type I restriction enzyme S subunit